ncbi:hypothetical protein LTR37_004894 [Vermiconidia calcicola]|uniref:Uncharacterized protein n=1 Tax=Vermiconidia calcicola TaxID=1690605 RepID=A0ACC3NKJ1_9PEZI|nr:hypothetical protein LTR37_004894 [Vermiconidia calcicola]
MKLHALVSGVLGCLHINEALANEQAVLHTPQDYVKNVAIVGAGAGGASAAYHLSRLAAAAGIAVNITVFERNSYVGGRSTTVNAYDDPSIPVELGGSVFVKVNHILNDAVKEFNLSTEESLPGIKVPGAALAIWNGQGFVVTFEDSWWDTAKLLWRYGLAPVKTMRLMRSVVGKFLKMYEEPAFPFESLTQVAQDLELLAVTAATGEQYLAENGIGGAFGADVVQASTRVNYAQNLKYIHGLETMVCMAAENAHSVRGGNWQIFDRMIAASNSTTLLETAVTEVRRLHQSKRLSLKVDSTDREDVALLNSKSYDDVVLAAPLQFSDISLRSLDVGMVDEIPYVQLHVTLFASPFLLSPAYFNLAPDKPTPRVILTTLPKGEKPGKGREGVGSPGFFSVSLLRPATNPNTGGQEYLYKIFSPSPPNATFLAHLLGVESLDNGAAAEISDHDITWIYRKVWNSYPYEYPRVTFERIRLADGLWYTGGMDSFISTMETNALMGMNVARLIVDGWLRKAE